MEGKSIPISRPLITDAESRAVAEVLASGWITQGPRVAAFEKAFATRVEAPHACAVSSCTTALHLALAGVGVRPGDVVLTVSLSFIATANAIRHCGAEPVFVDIDPATLNLCPAALARCLLADFDKRQGSLWYRHVDRLLHGPSPLAKAAAPRGRLAAILAVHQIGVPCDLVNLSAISKHYGIPLVEDAACAIGSEVSLDQGRTWQPVGQPVGDIACFSFHPRKVVTTGDGGMLTTRNSQLDRDFRLLRQHGMSVSDTARHSAKSVIFEDYEVAGFNYRLTDIQAAVGLAQLEKLPFMLAERRRLAVLYRRLLEGVAGLRLPAEPNWGRSNWQSFQIQLDRPDWQLPIMESLLQKGITTRRGVMSAHLEAPYRDAWPVGSLPATEAASRTGLILPLFPGMTDSDVHRVVAELEKSVRLLNRMATTRAA